MVHLDTVPVWSSAFRRSGQNPPSCRVNAELQTATVILLRTMSGYAQSQTSNGLWPSILPGKLSLPVCDLIQASDYRFSRRGASGSGKAPDSNCVCNFSEMPKQKPARGRSYGVAQASHLPPACFGLRNECSRDGCATLMSAKSSPPPRAGLPPRQSVAQSPASLRPPPVPRGASACVSGRRAFPRPCALRE